MWDLPDRVELALTMVQDLNQTTPFFRSNRARQEFAACKVRVRCIRPDQRGVLEGLDEAFDSDFGRVTVPDPDVPGNFAPLKGGGGGGGRERGCDGARAAEEVEEVEMEAEEDDDDDDEDDDDDDEDVD